MVLSALKKKEKAVIKALPAKMELASMLIEQGIYPDAEIALAHRAPFRGPIAYYLHGTKISMQPELAQQIEVEILK